MFVYIFICFVCLKKPGHTRKAAHQAVITVYLRNKEVEENS